MSKKTRRIRAKGMAMSGAAEPPAPLEVRDATVAPPVLADTVDVGHPVGRTIGRYRVCFEIAAGGMATVYLASLRGAAGFQKVVALKSIHPHLASDRRFVHMFLDEARIAARLNHPNVCQIFDFGEADGTYYLAMEYLAGEPLSRVVGRAAADTLRTPEWRALVARIVGDACAGLSAVHGATDPDGKPLDVVHRDVSPHNVFVTYDGVTKVVDFGIARAKHQVHRTETGEIKGNLPYAAPEQIRGPDVDPRADVWSLGAVLFEALTGTSLFQRETPVETMYAVLSAPVLRADEVAPWLPAAWADVVARALDRDRDARWPSAAEMGRALEALVRDESRWPSQADVAAEMDRLFPRGRARHAERLRVTGEAADASFEDERMPRRRTAMMLVAGGVAIAVASAGLAIALTRPDAEAPRATLDAPPPVAEPERAPAPPPLPAPNPTPAPASSSASTAMATAMEEREDRAPRRRRRVPRRHAAATGTGQLNLVTPDGWAIVYRGGTRLGQTPLRVTLPAGTHTLEVRPFGHTPPKRVRVTIPTGGTTRTTVRVAD